MAIVINTNVASLNAQRNLGKSQMELGTSMKRLSSGLRINSAKDDAAGLAISDRMTSQIRGLNQAARNANDGISMVQTADGALQESINIINTIKTKAIQAATDGQTTSTRRAIQNDIDKADFGSDEFKYKIIDEKDLNKSKLELLIEDLKTKYDEQKKYENLLEKSKDRIDYANNLTEQKHLDEISQHRHIQNKC